LIWCYRGHNPPKSEFVYKPQKNYVRFVQITDFKTDKSAVYVPVSSKNKMVFKGEIIMAAYRHIGKLSRAMEGAFNVALCKILEFQPMNRDFVELLIGTDVVKGELLRASQRGHIPSMHSNHLLSLLVPLPPLAEQHRIVAKVDELMLLCDRLKEQMKNIQTTQLHLADAITDHQQPDKPTAITTKKATSGS
jgi:type I restriction enzyme S subunit